MSDPPLSPGLPEEPDVPAAAPRGLRRGAFILPSLFTMGNILLGFYAVVLAYRGEFVVAAWMVVIAGILDMLDGRIARLTHTESEFGREFDSLADSLTFGAAPAWMAFLWGLHEYGRVGWLVPLFFLICTTVRLARFNVQTKSVDSRYFVGLPSPAAAATVICLFFVSAQLDAKDTQWMTAIFFTILPLSGSLMISTFRYPSFKRLDLRRKWSYRTAILLAIVLLVVTSEPVLSFEVVTATYLLSGPTMWLWGRLRRRRTDLPAPASESEQEPETA
ncbi:MAG: CDP-diacylglycerol--serine O-phosphatidyltransferase [Thermoanaerobaculia bacterium]|nr:CDP-diacylglycerol--serine O-phosphatidyltransferase [Thermoanaerobaculia bacterium]